MKGVPATPERIRWVAATIAAERPARILEIGCGPGHAIHLLIDLLPAAAITALDRSPVAIARATQVNRDSIEQGRVELHCVAIADFHADESYGAIFAVNVNAFWLDAARELDAIRDALSPDGIFHVFYEPPSPSQGARIEAECARRLREGGFTIVRIEREKLPTSMGIHIAAAG